MSDQLNEDERDKPRVRFCWNCGRKLRGNSFVEEVIDGHKRILHKHCSTPEGQKMIRRDDQELDAVCGNCIHLIEEENGVLVNQHCGLSEGTKYVADDDTCEQFELVRIR